MIIIKTIGILGKDVDNNIVFVKKIISRLNGVNVIGLFSSSDYSICDGFVIQGGRDIDDWFYDVVEYAIHSNKPLLGICLGCQVLGTFKNGSLKKCSSHLDTYHEMDIISGNLLYELFGHKIYVNSRHRQCIDKLSTYFYPIAYSFDGQIEAIALKDNTKFIIGVQFHPEDMDNMQILFDKFVSYL